jgi:hypothetical protein
MAAHAAPAAYAASPVNTSLRAAEVEVAGMRDVSDAALHAIAGGDNEY